MVVASLLAPAPARADDRIEFGFGASVLDDRPTYVPNGAGSADFVHRLYDGLLLRSPDVDGWAFWVAMLDTGRTDRSRIVDQFVDSPEFRQRFGTTDAAIVTNLYRNTLGRAPDAEGEEFWLGRLRWQPVADVVTFFLESDENKLRQRNRGATLVPVTELPFRYSNTTGVAEFAFPDVIRIDNNTGTFVRLDVPEYELPAYTAVYGGQCRHPDTGEDVGGVANTWLRSTDISWSGGAYLMSPDREHFWRIACVDTVEPGDYEWAIAHEVAHLWQPVVMGDAAYRAAAWPDPIERVADCVKVAFGGVAAYGLGPCDDTIIDELIVERMRPRN